MQYVHLVAVLALVQFIFFSIKTGRARVEFGVKAPAVSGHEGFERMYRVQMNTLEQLIIFLPALFIATSYWSALVVAGIGAVYIVGRFVYWRAYVANPDTRQLGFALTFFPTLILLIMILVGIVMTLIG